MILLLQVPAATGSDTPGKETKSTLDTLDLESSLTRHIEQIMNDIPDMPGLAVAVVRDTGIVYMRGFGHGDIETNQAFTPETSFYIASHSKAFMGMTAALLHHEGLLDLDAPISKYLPELSFQNVNLSAESITIRNLITHTEGIVNPAITTRTSYTGQHTARELIDILGKYSTAGSRDFSYSNLGHIVTALIIQRLMGTDWRHVVASRVFDPAGMNRTTGFTTEVDRRGWPLAKPYSAFGNPPHNDGSTGLERIPFWKTNQTIHGAGGHMSTVKDLARWIQIHLKDGQLGGKQIFPSSVIKSVRQPYAKLEAEFYRFQRTGYGLGWYESDFLGENLVHHFGSFAGYRTHVSFMPYQGVGVVALINEITDGFLIPDFVASCAYNLSLNKENANTKCNSERENLVDRIRSVRENRRQQFQKRSVTPSRPFNAYTGRYYHPALGTLAIAQRGEKLHAVIGLVETILDPLPNKDTLRVELGGSGTALRFLFPEGAVRAKSVELAGYQMERVSTGN